MLQTLPFRFESDGHRYLNAATEEEYPHITGLLMAAGLVSEAWYTEEASARGTAIHALTADYDHGALEVESCITPYRGYLLGHVHAMSMIPHRFDRIEEPYVHPVWRFGGRPDRVGEVFGLRAVLEGKSGEPERSHPVQTALQAILEAPRIGLPPERIGRFCLYWKDGGQFRLEEHTRLRDFDQAYRILREHGYGRSR